MKKKWFICFLVLLMCLSSSAVYAKSSDDFEDLKDLDAVTKAKFDAMISAGIFDGVSDEKFGLKDEMNRAQFAKVAALIFNLDVNASLKASSFSDVSADDPANGYALPYIEAVKAAGITDGYTPSEYNPAGKVTKEQLATFLVRGLGLRDDAEANAGVRDDSVSDWAKGYVALALEMKILANGEDGTFGGQSNATRDLLVTGAYESKIQHDIQAGKASPSPSPEPTPTATPEPTETPTPIRTPSPTVKPQPTPTATPEPTPSASPEPTPSVSPEPTPSASPEPTPSASPEPTPSVSPEPTPSASPEPTPSASPEPTPSASPEPTPSVSPEPTPSASPEPTPSASPEPTPSASPEPTPSASPEPTPSASPEPTPSASPEPTPSASPEPTPSASPEPTPSASPEPTPSVSPEPTPSASPEPSPSVSPEPTPSASPEPSQAPMTAEEALDAINAYYSPNSMGTAPSVAVFEIAGVTGVTEDNLFNIGSALSYYWTAPWTVSGIQEKVQEEYVTTIYNDLRGMSYKPLTAETFNAAGIVGVTATNLEEFLQHLAFEFNERNSSMFGTPMSTKEDIQAVLDDFLS